MYMMIDTYLKKAGLLLSLFLVANGMYATDVVRPTIPDRSFNVTDYGVTTLSTDNTTAFQNALNACGTAGGGTVIVPAGTFLCGPIVMKAGTNLYLSEGAVLQILPYGSGNGIVVGSYPNNGSLNQYPDFISAAKGTNNLMVSGTGTIYGNGSAWWTAYKDSTNNGVSMKRGCLIRFNRCSYIEIKDITLKEAPGVHVTIGQSSSNATITNITVNTTNTSPNTDGIDTWGPYINITNCRISCGDDNVAMDSGSAYVQVKHCIFGYGHGTSVGSYTTGVNNILVDSCSYTNTTNGVRLKSNGDRGGNEHDFTFSNLTMTTVTNPVLILSYYDKTPKTVDVADADSTAIISTTPAWKNVLIKNVTATGATAYAVEIYGRPEQHVKNITFDNVNISSKYGMIINYVDSVMFKNECGVSASSGNTVVQKYKSSFVDVLSSFDMTNGTTDKISASGTDATTGYQWNYSNMQYVSSYSTQSGKTYYQINSGYPSVIEIKAPDGKYFHNGDIVSLDMYTYKSGNTATVYASESLDSSNKIGSCTLTQNSAQNYYLFLSNVPDSTKIIYMAGTSTINSYVYVHGMAVYGVYDSSPSTGIAEITSDNNSSVVKSVRYYDLNGRMMGSALENQVVIKNTYYENGTTKSEKIFIK
jgi:polygalacturonase